MIVAVGAPHSGEKRLNFSSLNLFPSMCWKTSTVNQFLCASYLKPSMPSGASKIKRPFGFSTLRASSRKRCGFQRCSTTSEAKTTSKVSGVKAKCSASPEKTIDT